MLIQDDIVDEEPDMEDAAVLDGNINNTILTRIIHEKINDRWEVALCLSPEGEFRQASFVNGIWTVKGGTHVDYICDQIASKVVEAVKKRSKGVKITKAHVKK